jgi:hypothetical protein
MKKHRDANELAARIAAAANQPAGMHSQTASTTVGPELTGSKPDTRSPRSRKEPKETKLPDTDTVPISLRPDRALLNKYILKASDRTREAGRVISAQQIMLEVLERGDT